jgi:hypothetical protein
MTKAKSTKARDNLVRWRVSLITSTPAKLIDFTMAPDAETAEEQVAQAHDISAELRPRLVAVREDLRHTPSGAESHEPAAWTGVRMRARRKLQQ